MLNVNEHPWKVPLGRMEVGPMSMRLKGSFLPKEIVLFSTVARLCTGDGGTVKVGMIDQDEVAAVLSSP